MPYPCVSISVWWFTIKDKELSFILEDKEMGEHCKDEVGKFEQH